MCNLTDVMLSKYYPGARLTVLMIIPANFTISPFYFVSYLFIKINKSYYNFHMT
jgi:hypothetical protein